MVSLGLAIDRSIVLQRRRFLDLPVECGCATRAPAVSNFQPNRCCQRPASSADAAPHRDLIVGFGAAMPLRQGGQSCPCAAMMLHIIYVER
jgi:hypothetical protein